MSDGIYYIYKITNKINNKIYIGFTSKNPSIRLTEHISAAKSPKTYLQKAIKKYGRENFIIEEIDKSHDYNYCLNVLEPYYIKLYHAQDSNIGYNIANGGNQGSNYNNTKNYKWTKEQKEKLSIMRKLNPQTVSMETRQKISNSNKGKHPTEETRQKLSLSHKGQIPWNKGLKTSSFNENYIQKIDFTILKRNYIQQPLTKIIKTTGGYKYETPHKDDILYLYQTLNLSRKELAHFFNLAEGTCKEMLKRLRITKNE